MRPGVFTLTGESIVCGAAGVKLVEMTVWGISVSKTGDLEIKSMKMLIQPVINLIQLGFIIPPHEDENKPQDQLNFITVLKRITTKQYNR